MVARFSTPGLFSRFRFAGFVSFLCLASASLLAAAPGSSDLARVKERGELVMLCFPQEGSFFVRTMVRELGAEGLHVYGGADVELMRLFARRLGVELEVKPVRPSVADLIPALLRGEGDLIANALGVTLAREKLVDFSAPYITSQEGLVVRKDSGIDGIEDLAGKTAATLAGSSHEDVILRLDIDRLKLMYVDFSLEAYEAVLSGEADFTVLDALSARELLDEVYDLGQSLHVVTVLEQPAHYAFALRPGSDLEPVLDAWIEEIRANGTLERILSGGSADTDESTQSEPGDTGEARR